MIQDIEQSLKSFGAQVQSSTKDGAIIFVPLENLASAIKTLTVQHQIPHLSTITGLDSGQNIDVVYHFWKGDVIASIKTPVPKANRHAPSIVGVVPGAILYEMEVHDMFGVIFDGNPWMDRRLLLPENYPQDLPPPLLKDTKPAEIRKAVGVER